MQLLKFNDATGFYSFDNVDESGMISMNAASLPYIEEILPRPSSLIQQDTMRRGESEDKLFWLANSYMRHAEAENCLARLTAPGPQEKDELRMEHDHEKQADGMQQLCALRSRNFIKG